MPEFAAGVGFGLKELIATGITGPMSQEHDLKAEAVYLEMERDHALASLAATTVERDALARFKAWVHGYLDGKGVPHHPPGTHGVEGCRIGDRMDFVFDRMGKLALAVEFAVSRFCDPAALDGDPAAVRLKELAAGVGIIKEDS